MYSSTLLEFLGVGGGEMMLIIVAILLLFGGKKLPELARGLGKGIREFKDASEGVKREIHRNINSVTSEEETKEDLPAEQAGEKIAEENRSERHHPTEEEIPTQTTVTDEKVVVEEDEEVKKNKDSYS